jgi:hypothetical protein
VERHFDRDLLERYRPLIRFDSQEPYRAIAAESIADNPGNLLRLADGTVLGRAGGEGAAGLTLELLSAYPAGIEPSEDDRLDEAPDVIADALRMQAEERYRSRVYGSMATGGERTWLQYWLWLYYNPKHLLGFGKHEGDWELVQVGLDPAGEPDAATYSQHSYAERKPFSEVEVDESDGGRHAVVYCAPFSHASYFEAGTHFHLGGTDNPDGTGEHVLPRVEELGAWLSWVGRWGNSRGVLPDWSGGKLGGRSPASPGRQGGRKWSDPDAFHEDAKERPPRTKRVLWQLGRATYPRAPKLTKVRIEGQQAIVDYELTGNRIQQPSHLLVTVHDAEAAGEPVLISHAERIEARRGEARVLLPRVPERPLVRVSAFNRARQRSDVVEARLEGGP